MLVYGQIPSNAMPAGAWPTSALVGGVALAVSSNSGGNPVYLYEPGREEMQPPEKESNEFISAIAPILHELCP